MALRCDICGKGAMSGNRRSHSNIGSLVKRKVNLHPRSMGGRRIKACTSCIKQGKVTA